MIHVSGEQNVADQVSNYANATGLPEKGTLRVNATAVVLNALPGDLARANNVAHAKYVVLPLLAPPAT